MMNNIRIAIIGAGHLGTSLIGGLIEHGFPAKHIWATRKTSAELTTLRNKYGVEVTTDNHLAVKNTDVVIIMVKPQKIKDIVLELRDPIHAQQSFTISTAAGIPLQLLEKWLGADTPIVRVMPNTPAMLRTAAVGMLANAHANKQQCQLAEMIMNAVGEPIWVDDDAQMDTVTALSGSGPAYFFMFMEALQQAGIALGLSASSAEKLTKQTALGAAKMAIASEHDLATLRHQVTSPGGTTEQAIKVFTQAKISDIVKRAVQAAKKQGEILAKQADLSL